MAKNLGAIIIGSTLGVLLALSIGPTDAAASTDTERRTVRALERIATALERQAGCGCKR